MDYQFNGDIAMIYGVSEAVLIHNFYWWIAKNEANGRHYYDGHNWTYNTTKALSKLLPFFTPKQIRRMIENLKSKGALYVGNYNKKPFDRTQWYAISEEIMEIYKKGKCFCPNGQLEVTKRANGSAQMGTPIPDSKPVNKPIGKQISNLQKQTDIICSKITNMKLQELLCDYVDMRKTINSKMTDKALIMMIEKLKKLAPDNTEMQSEMVSNAIIGNWKSVFLPNSNKLSKGSISAPPSYDIKKIEEETFSETMQFGDAP